MSIKREFHQRPCACSICRQHEYSGAHSFGLLTPLDKAWNAWRWLFYVGRRGIWYLRWTGFWQAQPKWRRR